MVEVFTTCLYVESAWVSFSAGFLAEIWTPAELRWVSTVRSPALPRTGMAKAISWHPSSGSFQRENLTILPWWDTVLLPGPRFWAWGWIPKGWWVPCVGWAGSWEGMAGAGPCTEHHLLASLGNIAGSALLGGGGEPWKGSGRFGAVWQLRIERCAPQCHRHRAAPAPGSAQLPSRWLCKPESCAGNWRSVVIKKI